MPTTKPAATPEAKAGLDILGHLDGPTGEALKMRAESKGLTPDQYAIVILTNALEGYTARFK